VAGRCGGAVVAVWREPSPAPPDLAVQYCNPRELAEAAAVASVTSPALERHCCSPDGPGPVEPPRRWGAGWVAGPPLEPVPPLG
jgi:hypothetical protein